MNKKLIVRPGIVRQRQDGLLKAGFKEYFPHFLRLMYPNADEIFDIERGFTFMDKEMQDLANRREPNIGTPIGDLLVKVFLLSGEEKWILVHVEIEASNDEQMGLRMFQTYYRIFDLYDVEIESIVVYIGNEKQKIVKEYVRRGLLTYNTFSFCTYHIFQHTDDELIAMDTLFGLLILTCKKSLLEGKVSEKKLNEYRIMIAKELLSNGKYTKLEIAKFLNFLTNIIFIRDPEENRKLEAYII